jgi:hypothetical protein
MATQHTFIIPKLANLIHFSLPLQVFKLKNYEKYTKNGVNGAGLLGNSGGKELWAECANY